MKEKDESLFEDIACELDRIMIDKDFVIVPTTGYQSVERGYVHTKTGDSVRIKIRSGYIV